MEMPPLNDELRDILGRPCFSVAHVAKLLAHAKMFEVQPKAEDEQAVALYWMLTLYFKHGDKWIEEGNKILQEIRSTLP